MVIIPDFAAVADGLSFTIGQITWTTGINGFTATASEEAQIRSACTTRDENGTDIFRPYSRPNPFRGVLIRPYLSPDI
jgi:hypothetical protein